MAFRQLSLDIVKDLKLWMPYPCLYASITRREQPLIKLIVATDDLEHDFYFQYIYSREVPFTFDVNEGHISIVHTDPLPIYQRNEGMLHCFYDYIYLQSGETWEEYGFRIFIDGSRGKSQWSMISLGFHIIRVHLLRDRGFPGPEYVLPLLLRDLLPKSRQNAVHR